MTLVAARVRAVACAAGERFERHFDGQVTSAIYPLLRIGLALTFLARHADWLRPWLSLEHHRSVHGLMFYDSEPTEPMLRSAWFVGMALGTPATRALVWLRTVLSVTLLLGVRARLSAALLGSVSLALLAGDRYRYYHHLFLLYVALLWLSLAPIDARFTLGHALRWAHRRIRQQPRGGDAPFESRAPEASPAWPLQLVRALTLSVYAAAGFSKLHVDWLRGESLRQLELLGVLGGPVWRHVQNVLGYSGVAWCTGVFELGVCALLCARVTRRVAVVFALAFHAMISACMPVFSFGAQMAVLLLSFVPNRRLQDGSLLERNHWEPQKAGQDAVPSKESAS